MSNLTLRIEDDLLAESRKLAAKRETTVNRMVREFLSEQTEFEKLKAKRESKLKSLFDAMDDAGPTGKAGKLDREELYDR